MKHLQSYYLLAISLAKTHKLYCQCLKSGGFCADFCGVWTSLDAVAVLLVISAETQYSCVQMGWPLCKTALTSPPTEFMIQVPDLLQEGGYLHEGLIGLETAA